MRMSESSKARLKMIPPKVISLKSLSPRSMRKSLDVSNRSSLSPVNSQLRLSAMILSCIRTLENSSIPPMIFARLFITEPFLIRPSTSSKKIMMSLLRRRKKQAKRTRMMSRAHAAITKAKRKQKRKIILLLSTSGPTRPSTTPITKPSASMRL